MSSSTAHGEFCRLQQRMINYRSSYCGKGSGIIGILASFVGAVLSVLGKELLILGPVSQNVAPEPVPIQ